MIGTRGISRLLRNGAMMAIAASAAALPAQDLMLISAPEDPYVIGVQADRTAAGCQLSQDGRIAVFTSAATQLIEGDDAGITDVFVKDRDTGVVERVNVRVDGSEAEGYSGATAISGDGRYVAFFSDDDLTLEGSTTRQIYLYDRDAGVLTLVSHALAGGPSNLDSNNPSINASGTYVAFDSSSDDLVAGDGNAAYDVFRYDIASGAIERVSTDAGGGEADASSFGARMNATGNIVAFASSATNLVPGDANGLQDVFLKVVDTGLVVRISVSTSGGDADAQSTLASISADASTVVFNSGATNLVVDDTNGVQDVFVRRNGMTRRADLDAGGNESVAGGRQGLASAQGRYIAFVSGASDLAGPNPSGFEQIYVKDLATGAISRHTDTSAQIYDLSSASTDGTTLCFTAAGDDFVADDTNGRIDVFALDVATDTFERVDLAATPVAMTAGDSASAFPDISDDGSRVVFTSLAQFLDADAFQGDSTITEDIFVREMATGAITRLSNAWTGGPANDSSDSPRISGSGRFVAFASQASNLVSGFGDGNGVVDIFRIDIDSGAIIAVDQRLGGGAPEFGAYGPSISDLGDRIAFVSFSPDLVAGDTNTAEDVFVWSVAGGVERASVSTAGEEAVFGSYTAEISGDGNAIVFDSRAPNLVADDLGGYSDIFLRDLAASQTVRISVNEAGEEANGDSTLAAVSRDANVVAFLSEATNLVPGDLSPGFDVVVVDRAHGSVRLATAALASLGYAEPALRRPFVSPDGGTVLFAATAVDGRGALLRYRRATDALEVVQAATVAPPFGTSPQPLGFAASADGSSTVFDWVDHLLPVDDNDPRVENDIYLLHEDIPDSIFADGFDA